MKTKQKIKVKTASLNDMIFTFKYASPVVMPDLRALSKDEAEKIEQAIKFASKEICIDKTYVDFIGTKYDKTFITEDGWKGLCEILDLTDFGKDVDKKLNDAINESYREMIVQYLYLFIADLGYDPAKVVIDMPKKSKFMTTIQYDTHVDTYPGKWQTWECNQ